MKAKSFAFAVVLFLSLLAVPAAFAVPKNVYISTKQSENFVLPLTKNSKSIVCVNRNFNDTQNFGNAFCELLDKYSSDCRVLLAEFVPKEKVSYFDYVWTFQVKKWTDKNVDGIPESVSALVLLYDKDFKLLLKSNLRASKNKKDPSAPECLEALLTEYIDSLFNDIVQVSEEVTATEKPAKQKKSKKNEEQAQ